MRLHFRWCIWTSFKLSTIYIFSKWKKKLTNLSLERECYDLLPISYVGGKWNRLFSRWSLYDNPFGFPYVLWLLTANKIKTISFIFLLIKNNKENKNYRNILKFVHLKIGSLVDGRHYQFGKLGRLFFQINF